MKKGTIVLIILAILLVIWSIYQVFFAKKVYPDIRAGKPVIYLYPSAEQDIEVKLGFRGTLDCTYPEYHSGWKVHAYPDGRLINIADGREFSYLFWDGNYKKKWDMHQGFVVKGEDTAAFLQNTLPKLGLLPKEYNEFIVYWYPKMKNNRFNLIYFAGKDYEELAPMEVYPEPNQTIRVYMVYRPLDQYVEVDEEKIVPVSRKGYTLVEWGGTELN